MSNSSSSTDTAEALGIEQKDEHQTATGMIETQQQTTPSNSMTEENEKEPKVEPLNPNELLMQPGTASSSTSAASSLVDEATVQKIIHFWNHPSLRQVSPEQKQEYLKQKGISKEQLFHAWDRIVMASGENSMPPSSPLPTPLQPPPTTAAAAAAAVQQQSQYAPSRSPPPLHQNYSATTPPPPQPLYYNDDEEDGGGATDMNNSASNMAMVATVGGVVGLWAAAAVRWLNGGDFVVFPPASHRQNNNNTNNKDRFLPLQLQNNTNNTIRDGGAAAAAAKIEENVPTIDEEGEEEEDDENIDYEDDDNDEEDDDDDNDDADELAQYLSSSTMKSINNNSIPNHTKQQHYPTTMDGVVQQALVQFTAFSEAMQQQVTLQQRMLQKLTSNSNNTNNGSNNNVTDKSMQVLRQQASSMNQSGTPANEGKDVNTADPMVWYKLVEIYAELTCLKRDLYVGECQQQNNNRDQAQEASSEANGNTTTRSSSKLCVSEETERRLQDALVQLQIVLQEIKPHKNSRTEPPTSSNEQEKEEVTTNPGVMTTTTTTDTTSTNDNGVEHQDTNDTGDNNDRQKDDASSPAESAATEPARSDALHQPLQSTGGNENDKNNDSQHLLKMRQAVIHLIRNNASNTNDGLRALKAGAQIMFLYVSNLSKNPHVPRYRKVFTSNESFQKVDKLDGAREFLYALGFVAKDNDKYLEWPPAAELQTSTADNNHNEATTTTLQTNAASKEELVQTYHLKEATGTLKVLKLIQPNDNGEEAILSLLERALETLPVPPAMTSTVASQESQDDEAISSAPAAAATNELPTTLEAKSNPSLPATAGQEESAPPLQKTYAEAILHQRDMRPSGNGISSLPEGPEKEHKAEEETNAIWK